MTETIHTLGWKGEDNIEISKMRGQDAYVILNHRKSKETGEVMNDQVIIPAENVRVLWDILRKDCELHTQYQYKYVVRKLIRKYHICKKEGGVEEEMMISAFNGGKFRAKYYFDLYYYPMKVLESKHLLAYGGRGTITLLSAKDL